jgi:hypothetical protein
MISQWYESADKVLQLGHLRRHVHGNAAVDMARGRRVEVNAKVVASLDPTVLCVPLDKDLGAYARIRDPVMEIDLLVSRMDVRTCERTLRHDDADEDLVLVGRGAFVHVDRPTIQSLPEVSKPGSQKAFPQ